MRVVLPNSERCWEGRLGQTAGPFEREFDRLVAKSSGLASEHHFLAPEPTAATVKAIAEGTKAIAEGTKAIAEGTNAIAEGTNANCGSDKSNCSSNKSIAPATNAIAEGTKAIAEGTKAVAEATNAVAEGTKAVAEGTKAIAPATKLGMRLGYCAAEPAPDVEVTGIAPEREPDASDANCPPPRRGGIISKIALPVAAPSACHRLNSIAPPGQTADRQPTLRQIGNPP